jgi:preprotein translocase subunit SecG
MTILLTIIHIFVCVFLVIVVLLQSGKAADLAGAFGGMGSQTTFGPRGAATVLSKATTIAAGLFMVTSLTLSIVATRNAGTGSSVLERAGKAGAQKSAPAQGSQTAVPPPAGAPAGAPAAAPTDPSKQPMVEFVNEKGDVVKKQPLDLSKAPKVDPGAQPAPAQTPAAPVKK